MAIKTRQTAPQKVKRGPSDPTGWARLMGQLIERARLVGANTTAMQAALGQGRAEAYLRREGILTPTCIDREYPDLK
jgi:hypothetical protein